MKTQPEWENMFPVDLDMVPLPVQKRGTDAFRRAGADPSEGKIEWRFWPPSYHAARLGEDFFGDDGEFAKPELDPADFWAGEYGNEYAARNESEELLENNRRFFEMALLSTRYMHPQRAIEFGANIGMNLRALRKLGAFALTEFTGVDVNRLAVERLEHHGFIAHHADMTTSRRPWGESYDFTLVKGVLIHISPDKLQKAYAAIYEASSDLIMLCEYFSATRREVEYRGHKGKLWLADYGSEFMDAYPDLECISYGFQWSRDPVAPQDSLNWWLFSKKCNGRLLGQAR